jgi:hypothetical protein
LKGIGAAVGMSADVNTAPKNRRLLRCARSDLRTCGLFSGMRFGETIQLQVADVKELEGIQYFNVTPIGFDAATPWIDATF